MNTPILAQALSEPIISPSRKKRVLLVDGSPTKRDRRAESMRRLGMYVDCAMDISEARSWWRADLYNLVLISGGKDLGLQDKFCEDIRSATPPQQIAFLVGKPSYLADSPNADGVLSAELAEDALVGGLKAVLADDVTQTLPQRWGILEASRRISEVRSLSHARSRAKQDRPDPPRDLETRESKRTTVWSQVLPELQKEELQ
jgi:hypothetical protein